ncbi:MAG: 2-hydroxy-3-oxopropionate reductase [Chloroflexota bacterium]
MANGPIGLIGLGIMGKPMARNLLKAGHKLIVYDIVPQSVDEIMSEGAEGGRSAKDVAEKCEFVITMVPNSPHVKAAIFGENGVAEGIKPGSLVVDMSSIDPGVSREVGTGLKEKGVRFLDAPVSGGEPKAIDGTLAIMVGGAQADFDEAKPIFDAMGSAVLCGDIGAGQVTKLANQIVVALNIAAVGEALTLAMKSGVDPDLVYKAIRGGLAGSTVMDAKAPMMMDRNFKPGFRISLHIKDLQNALSAGQNTGTPLPLTAFAMEMMQAIKVDGHLEDDHSALVFFSEKLANIEVHRTANK